MSERDESYGVGLAELMNPEVARNPQPIYAMLQETDPIFRLDGVGVIVGLPGRRVTRCCETPSCSRRARTPTTSRPGGR